MSERYSECGFCQSLNCFICGGTGFSGNSTDYIADQNRTEWEREQPPGWWTLSEYPIQFQLEDEKFYRNPKSTPALEAAVLAFKQHIQKRKIKMNPIVKKEIVVPTTTSLTLAQKFGFTESQIDLIRRKVAQGASDDELEMFFYQCQVLEANPLMPGQIYFVKFGNSPGTIITGINTFRNHAHKTGKLAGVKRGVIRNANGECIGGWADVYRTDWKEPAHEEVALNEYNTGRSNWKTMPETMIKKVAEVAAYRMAFPQQLGGLYVNEEMDKVMKDVDSTSDPKAYKKPSQAQIARLYAIAKANGISKIEELKQIVLVDYGHSSPIDLSINEYNELCTKLESKKNIAESTGEVETPELIPESSPEFESAAAEIEVPWAKYRDSQIVK